MLWRKSVVFSIFKTHLSWTVIPERLQSADQSAGSHFHSENNTNFILPTSPPRLLLSCLMITSSTWRTINIRSHVTVEPSTAANGWTEHTHTDTQAALPLSLRLDVLRPSLCGRSYTSYQKYILIIIKLITDLIRRYNNDDGGVIDRWGAGFMTRLVLSVYIACKNDHRCKCECKRHWNNRMSSSSEELY